MQFESHSRPPRDRGPAGGPTVQVTPGPGDDLPRGRAAGGEAAGAGGGTKTGRRLDYEGPPRDSGGTTKAAAGTPDALVPWKHLGPPQVAKTATHHAESPLRGTEAPLGDQPRQGSCEAVTDDQ